MVEDIADEIQHRHSEVLSALFQLGIE